MAKSLPASRIPDPKAAPALNWGVIAPGGIAHAFAHAVQTYTHSNIVAVGSRSQQRADAAAAAFGATAHGSYEALVTDPQVEAVYVASPHSHHYDHACLALAAGKPTLVEKAFTRDQAQAIELVASARAAGVLLMEAMWTRFLPRTDVVRQLLADGELGEIVTVLADHGQDIAHVERLRDPALAGGALLDLGIYPVSFAVMCLGLPGRVRAVGVLAETGVDGQVTMTLDRFAAHPRAQAALNTTMWAKTPTTAAICGTAARIELAGDFYTPGPVRLVRPDGKTAVGAPEPLVGHEGMAYEAAHFADLVAAGATESPLLPLAETVAIMGIMDDVRSQLSRKEQV